MKVIYSIGARFAGGGIGTIAYHAVRGLQRHRLLHRLLCGSYRPTEIPRQTIRAMGLPSRALRKLAVYDGSGWLWELHNQLYDVWAARQMTPGDLFHGWGNMSLHTLQRARSLGMVTVIERASSHPLVQERLLREEHTRWGLSFGIRRSTVQRMLQEIEEADYVVIPSDFVRRSFLDQGFPEERLIQVSFGADVDRFRPADRPSRGPFRVLFVGQVGIRKGVAYLLEAWRQLGWRDAELWVVGRVAGELKPILTRYADLLGIQFIGHVTDPVTVYQSADAFAFPTIEEGSALVTYEALACGLPVVTTANAGAVVRDGVEGFIVPIRDVEALATALDRLRADEGLRLEMGRAARMRAEEFTWKKYGDSLARAYEQLVLE